MRSRCGSIKFLQLNPLTHRCIVWPLSRFYFRRTNELLCCLRHSTDVSHSWRCGLLAPGNVAKKKKIYRGKTFSPTWQAWNWREKWRERAAKAAGRTRTWTFVPSVWHDNSQVDKCKKKLEKPPFPQRKEVENCGIVGKGSYGIGTWKLAGQMGKPSDGSHVDRNREGSTNVHMYIRTGWAGWKACGAAKTWLMRRDPKENSQKPDEGIGKSVPQGFHSNDFLIPRTSVKLNLEFLKKKKKHF